MKRKMLCPYCKQNMTENPPFGGARSELMGTITFMTFKMLEDESERTPENYEILDTLRKSLDAINRTLLG